MEVNKYYISIIYLFLDKIDSTIDCDPILLKRVENLTAFQAFKCIFSLDFWELLKVINIFYIYYLEYNK